MLVVLWEVAPFLDSHEGDICLPNHRHWGAALGQGAPLPHLHKSCCMGWQRACSTFIVSQACTELRGHKFSLCLQSPIVSSNCTHVHPPRETQLQTIDNSGGQGAVAQIPSIPVTHPDTARIHIHTTPLATKGSTFLPLPHISQCRAAPTGGEDTHS